MCDFVMSQELASIEERIEALESEAMQTAARRLLARKGPDLVSRLLDIHDEHKNDDGPAATREDLLELGFTAEEIDAAESGESA